MLTVELPSPSHSPSPATAGIAPSVTLADLSRNASVISSSSSSGSASDLLLNTPRPRPLRTFSSPRSRSRDGPTTPVASKPPAYLTRDFALDGDRSRSNSDVKLRAQSRSKSRTKSRNSSVGMRLQANDFEFGDILGEGSYSEVHYAVYPPTLQEYAIKILDKGHLKRNNKLSTAIAERDALVRLGAGHPGIVRLHWAFHDEWSLYFVLDLARNGEFQTRIHHLGSLSISCARYYAAQIVDAVAYMHSKNVIHRDLKPENLLLDDAMRIKITDFGTAKILDGAESERVDRAGTFVGTAQYVSPELLSHNTTNKSSDLWAVGCIIYQMIAGRFPFQGMSEYLTWQKIKSLEYSFPDGFDVGARDLVQRLLVLDPTQRLGAGDPGAPNDMNALRSHPFFKEIDWAMLWLEPAPPLEPGLVKKDHKLASKGAWDDYGAAWDKIVGGIDEDSGEYEEEDEEDEEETYVNTNGGEYPLVATYQFPPHGNGHDVPAVREIGPMDDVPPEMNSIPFSADPTYKVDALEDAVRRGRAAPAGVPLLDSALSQPVSVPKRLSPSRESGTSSSEGSPPGTLTSAMEGLSMDRERGRDRVQTPIQLTTPSDTFWSSVLQPDEMLIFHSNIDAFSRSRRLTASLIPMTVSAPRKLKKRHLILTNRRLLCVKQKARRNLVIKSEGVLSKMPKEKDGMVPKEKTKEDKKEKDVRLVIIDAIARGGKDFAVITNGKLQQYSASDPSLAARWLSELQGALERSISTSS